MCIFSKKKLAFDGKTGIARIVVGKQKKFTKH